MLIEPADLDPRALYQLMVSCVIPRPVAWISTISADGTPNLAPFSFFGGVTSYPPTVMISIGRRKGAHKDTTANLLATGDAVIHIASRALADALVATSAEVDPSVNEFDLAGIARLPSSKVKPDRVADAPIAMEARVERHLEVGKGPADVFLLEIIALHVDDAVTRDGLPYPERVQAIGRLGGSAYCDTGETFDIPRP